ncbi:hypothetical protein D9M69_576000 [compost metagenome]
MAGSAFDLCPCFGDAGHLAQARQRIELTKEGDHRTARARLTDKGRIDLGQPARHAKSVLLQHRDLGRSRPFLVKAQFRMFPDRVAHRGEFGLQRLDGFDKGGQCG